MPGRNPQDAAEEFCRVAHRNGDPSYLDSGAKRLAVRRMVSRQSRRTRGRTQHFSVEGWVEPVFFAWKEVGYEELRKRSKSRREREK